MHLTKSKKFWHKTISINAFHDLSKWGWSQFNKATFVYKWKQVVWHGQEGQLFATLYSLCWSCCSDTFNTRTINTSGPSRWTHTEEDAEIYKHYNFWNCTRGEECKFTHACWNASCRALQSAKACPLWAATDEWPPVTRAYSPLLHSEFAS